MLLIQQYRKPYYRLEQAAGRSSRKKKQALVRSALPARHGFLNHAFKPIAGTAHRELRNRQKVEGDFFQSLDHLAAFYQFTPLQPSAVVFPCNLNLAFEHAKKCMTTINSSVELKVMQDKGRTAIAAEKTFDTGDHLYYIPVKPLHLLLKDRKHKRTAKLLLSLFSMLYRRGVAPHTDNFLGCQYEMIFEWVLENAGDWEPDEQLKMVSDYYAQKWYGEKLFRQIRHPYHGEQFANRIDTYQPQYEWEQEILNLCKLFHALFSQYPDRSFLQQIPPIPEDECDNELIYPDCYLSFFWTDDDGMYESLMESVNNSLQECSRSLDPVSLQFFDNRQERETHDFYFEWRFLLLIDHLCYLLYEMP